MLDGFTFINNVSPAASARIRREAQVRSARAKDRLVHRGARIGGVFLVEEGALRVYNITAAGRESTLYWVEPGDSCILAMNCLFTEMRYPAWVEGDAPTSRFTVISAPLYRELFATEPAIQRFTFDVLSNRVLELMTFLEEAMSLGVEARVASLLVLKCDDHGAVNMSHETLANHLGTAREVVSRTLRELARRNLVETSRGRVRIVDAEALAALADY